MTEKIVMTKSSEATAAIFGSFDLNVRIIENAFDVRISNGHGGEGGTDAILVKGEGDNVDKAARTLEYLKHMSGAGETLGEQSVEYVISLVKDNSEESPESLGREVICVTGRGKPIKAKTVGQRKYVETIKNNTIILGLGPTIAFLSKQ